jgi:hypothetical protein
MTQYEQIMGWSRLKLVVENKVYFVVPILHLMVIYLCRRLNTWELICSRYITFNLLLRLW